MDDLRSTAQRWQDRRNERALKVSADASQKTARSVEQMLSLTAAQVELAAAARADAERSHANAERSEKFTRIMAWSSLGVSVASLGAAVVAIIVSL